MRVITGAARGRKLFTPDGMDIRPTADKVKEAIFSIIQFDIEGRRALDLFAGTGQLGIEALSRGAESCVFVDESRAAIKLIEKNIQITGLQGAKVAQAEAMSFLSSSEKYDLIFLDPPYSKSLLENALERISAFDKLSSGGIIICEYPVGKELPEMQEPYGKLKTYKYGKITITVYTKSDH